MKQGEWSLMPPKPGACTTCAVIHPPDRPHNPDSLYWATKNELEGKPPPTWDDALAHVSDEIHEIWANALAFYHVTVVRRYTVRRAPDFLPGQVIRRRWGDNWLRYEVQDPVRTKAGKLRLHALHTRRQSVQTTWWKPGALPPDYEVEPGWDGIS